MMITRNSSITAPLGFKASALNSGIKKKKLDLALVFSEFDAVCAGVFTSNRFKAAPVVVTKNHMAYRFHRAVIINSGNANCLTKTGISDATSITGALGSLIGCAEKNILVCSTGIIGKRLPVEKICAALPVLVTSLSRNNGHKAAQAIMTTDTFAKEFAVSFNIGAKKVTVAGMAKGAGMIAPDMATMISVITTDAAISKNILHSALKQAVAGSFNAITVDGSMSTNDTVLILANGASGATIAGSAYNKFLAALKAVCLELARMIVKDAEGATKFIEIETTGAKDKIQAKSVCMAVANNNLFKSMCFGEDPNFGRVAAACGMVKDVNPSRVDIYLNGISAVRAGIALEKKLSRRLFSGKEIKIKIDINLGSQGAKAFTSDLTPEYVKLNAEYS